MASNITLPRASSQTNISTVIQPRKEYKSDAQAWASALPGLASALVSGMKADDAAEAEQARLARQQRLDTQKVEDAETLGLVAADINALSAERDQAFAVQNTLQGLAVDVEQAFADGDISEADKELQKQFIAQFEKLQVARKQGLLDDSRFNIKVRTAKSQMLMQHKHLGKEINDMYEAVTGNKSSNITGAAAQQQLLFNQKMEQDYGINYTPQDVLTEMAKQRALRQMEEGKQFGTANFGRTVSTTNTAMNVSVDTIINKTQSLYNTKQGLTQDELDGLLAYSTQQERAILGQLDEQVAQLRQSGNIIAVGEVRAQKEYIQRQFETLRGDISSKDIQKVLAKRKQVQDLMWQNDMGGQISRLNAVAGTMGSGGLTALSGFIGAATPEQERIIRAMSPELANADVDGLRSVKDLVMDSAIRASQPVHVPGFEKLDAFFGFGAMKAGPTGKPVQQNTLRNLNKLVEEPQDVIGAIKQLNDPKISMTYKESEQDVKNELVQNVNGWESMVYNTIQDGGYTVNFDNQTQTIQVYREQAVPAGERFGQGQSALGLPDTRRVFNHSLQRSLQEIYNLHNNPNYVGVLQDPMSWISDLTNALGPQPEQPAE